MAVLRFTTISYFVARPCGTPIDNAARHGGHRGKGAPRRPAPTVAWPIASTIYPNSPYPRNGGLLSYGVDTADVWRRAATYVDRILRGAKPGDLPVQFPVKYEMVVNRKTAKALGLEVPLSILVRADEVIE